MLSQVMANQALARAEQALADPPAALRRFGDAWRKYVSKEGMSAIEEARGSVVAAIRLAQREGRPTAALAEAVEAAENRWVKWGACVIFAGLLWDCCGIDT